MDETELTALLKKLETDRLELKRNFKDGETIRETVCAFANDLPAHKKPGYIFVGIEDDGSPSNLDISDELLRNLADMRTDGTIGPPVSLTVERVEYKGAHVAAVIVHPSESTPVRYRGRTCIRIGTRRGYATIEEEKRLAERSTHMSRPFDQRPCPGSSLGDILVDVVRGEYLPRLVAPEVIAENGRSPEEWLASVRFFEPTKKQPSHAGILLFGREPLQFVPGAYVQFVRFDGPTRADAVIEDKQITGNITTQLRALEELIPLHIKTSRSAAEGLRHQSHDDYPLQALREMVLNAVMHRTYDGTNAPIQIHWYEDRVVVMNPGGLYGQVTHENFGKVSDYRNPTIAEALKVLGYVDRYGSGIERIRRALDKNGNPAPEFEYGPASFQATARRRT